MKVSTRKIQNKIPPFHKKNNVSGNFQSLCCFNLTQKIRNIMFQFAIKLEKLEKLHFGPNSGHFWAQNFKTRFFQTTNLGQFFANVTLCKTSEKKPQNKIFSKSAFQLIFRLHVAVTSCEKNQKYSTGQILTDLEKPHFRFMWALSASKPQIKSFS